MNSTPQIPASSPEPIRWHSAFFQAIQAELLDYKDKLEFKQEYPLTTEPLRIDTIIIVKPSKITIDNNIARIFRKINVWEYKSPGKYLSIKDFYKVYSYATLFVAITADVEMRDMTLTFAGSTCPCGLIRYLREERQYQVAEVESGIHYITGDYLPIQIINTKRLGADREGDAPANWLLKDLNRGLEREEVLRILKKSEELTKAAPLDAYLYALIQANPKIFEEVLKMAEDTMTVEDVLMRTGILPKWINRTREEERQRAREGARKQKQMGVSPDIIAAGFGFSLEEIEEL